LLAEADPVWMLHAPENNPLHDAGDEAQKVLCLALRIDL
jgi:hypothetical protein